MARFVLTLGVWGLIAAIAALTWASLDLPAPDMAAALARRPSVTVLSADGARLSSYGDLYGETIDVRDLPPILPQAVMAVEDRRFYSHLGVDPLGIIRAMAANLRAGRLVEGGSTLTQQVAKTLFLTPERTLKRKIQELMLAVWLEHAFTKDQILTLYLNKVYLGAGAYGVEAASQRYFGHSARDVNTYQAALLAGLLKAPSRYNPAANPKAARARARVALASMVDAGVITAEEAATARATASRSIQGANVHPAGRYFADWVMERIEDYLGTVQGDLIARTTLDSRLQDEAGAILARRLAREGRPRKATQGAIVVMTPEGAVKAMIGGVNYGDSQFNRATQASRQPGSAFKPVVFLTALEAGYQPDDLVDGSPITVGGWTPRNYGTVSVGVVPLREAAARSFNTAAVRLCETLGRGRVIETAQRLGLSLPDSAPPSIALGSQGMSVLEMTAAYLPFANGGYGVFPHGLLSVETRSGDSLYRRRTAGMGRIIRPEVVARMNELLRGVIEAPNGTGRKAALDRPAAGKTGTTQNHRDAWFVGYTPDFVAGVWIGNDDDSPMEHITGGGLPALVWKDVMTAAHRGIAPKALPRPPAKGLGGFLRALFGAPEAEDDPSIRR